MQFNVFTTKWVLHESKSKMKAQIDSSHIRLSVGSENKMKHHLQGYLAGLSVLVNKLEKPAVLACLHKCKESLEVPAMELLEPGMELLTNSGKQAGDHREQQDWALDIILP